MPLGSLSRFMPSELSANTHLPVWISDTMARWFGLARGGAFRPAARFPKGVIIPAPGQNIGLTLSLPSRRRRAKVSVRFLVGRGARRLSGLNRNDRSTGRGGGMQGGTNKHTGGVGHGRNTWKSAGPLSGRQQLWFFTGKVLQRVLFFSVGSVSISFRKIRDALATALKP